MFWDDPPAAAAEPASMQCLVDAHTDPHGLFDRLRARESVAFDPAGRCWIVTGHESVRRVLSDARFVADPALAATAPRRPTRRSFISEAVHRQILFAEGPRQASAQRAVLTELSRRSDALQPPMKAAAYALAQQARARGSLDVVAQFAVPFSLEAISVILGLPPRDAEETERLERWATTFADVTSGWLDVDMDHIALLGDWFREQVAARRGAPTDDLIGALMRDGGLDDEEDVVIQSMMAFAAGRVTTQKALGNGIPLLLPEWSAWRERVAASPAALRKLTEELLRVVTPTRYVVRWATEDAVLDDAAGGASVRRGDKVALFLEAANRDPEAFACPHALDGDRTPNRHVAFGFGSHRCPGAGIARLEIQIALQALLETLPDLRPDPAAAPGWDPNPNLGGYSTFRCLC